MSDIFVFDDFLPPQYFDVLQKAILGYEFSWYLVESATGYGVQTNLSEFGFNHNIFDNDVSYSALQPLLAGFYGAVQEKTFCGKLLKARMDMTVMNPDGCLHQPHIDMSAKNNITVILYITDSLAPTVIYKNRIEKNGDSYGQLEVEQEVLPKENRIVVFDGQRLHTGNSPKSEVRRVLLNCNFER